ncbi:polyprenyl synthetase family protein [Thalassorhabdomicrobium marinisediminis]|uniref:Geranylgeranyl diphosphate synthase n=1 Tax=Thalassorhabdomicrobium marinisediminis TaxID=2170577 RepID=A0A2T7G001_9RHOB|nr:polyprenyl synthetase family protein [Thalassorhabdomicrobium marinisediminis]PVA07739.1 farnesyl-diphosphate synthase [Thalassorhabdomicrobium marinisediminis]
MADAFRQALSDAQGMVRRWSEKSGLAQSPDASTLSMAMGSALAGGKAFRAFLVLESSRLYDVDEEPRERAAFAIECLHAYSLVHDDLPCMDDDDMRRGRPTVHREWDEATAVLTGDALQTLAFQLVSNPRVGPHAASLTESLARASMAMVRGQMADIAAERVETPLTLQEITQLQSEKTGALITWASTAGPQLVGAHSEGLSRYAKAIGLAFQIADDVLDETGDAAAVGKAVGKDSAAGKATFVSHLGLDGARARARELVEEACDALDTYGDAADTLKQAAQFVVDRTH